MYSRMFTVLSPRSLSRNLPPPIVLFRWPSNESLTADRFYNSRRRRRQGRTPMYGTGWLPYNSASPYDPNHPQNKPPGYGDPNFHPPPPYLGGQATGTTFNSNAGYYGNHGAQPGGSYELQQPSSSYQPPRGGDPVYDAPAGPPPGKGH